MHSADTFLLSSLKNLRVVLFQNTFVFTLHTRFPAEITTLGIFEGSFSPHRKTPESTLRGWMRWRRADRVRRCGYAFEGCGASSARQLTALSTLTANHSFVRSAGGAADKKRTSNIRRDSLSLSVTRGAKSMAKFVCGKVCQRNLLDAGII